MKKNIVYLSGVLFLLIAVSACKKENNSNLKSVFSYVADGFRVTFTNFSTGAKEYHWDFGDKPGDSSSLKSPQHIFSKKGDFLVSLTATDGGQTNTFTDTVSIVGPNIKIDGDFSDWEYVEYAHTNDENFAGTIRAIKAFATAQDINFLVEGTADMKLELVDMFIDADNDPATGYGVADYPAGSGTDYLLEGPAASPSWGSVYIHTGTPAEWVFNPVSSFDAEANFSAIKPVSGKNIIEFSIKKSALGSIKGYINFALVELNSGWSAIGRIPQNGTPESKFIAVQL
ncbi:PKD domain-containing protein [Agriterribacter sp.]|uniref:PKD domain-containing protein n=1 Tax=Agriterribacter sp. TaxID=2821509 RepID=UPI002C533F79|nr:PKD domain-containing protein [Agriterribacter sp.]HRP57373.1 PKD domain-containing protein [Agriterribacter sp.]